jgi:hypothetical protein
MRRSQARSSSSSTPTDPRTEPDPVVGFLFLDKAKFAVSFPRPTVVEERRSHAIYVSQPKAVAAIIANAAESVNVAAV